MNMEQLPTPCYVVDEALIERNLKILQDVVKRTGCKILLAQKAFSLYTLYPLIGQYLNGTTASSLYEAKLGREEMGKETHIFAAAYRESELDEIVSLCDHIVFNSFSQLERFGGRVLHAGKEIGLRLNPECSTQEGHAIYDPCAPFSRLGITQENFRADLLEGVTGFHFHTLCEQGADALIRTVEAVEKHFGKFMYQMKWINFGGGQLITRADYDLQALEDCITHIQRKYDVQVYLEPGEAVALNAGYLISKVLDVVHNGMDIAILDTSAACHMPDVLEMPYTPPVLGSAKPGEKQYTYRLAGPTCLA
ncbi:MAG TPA: carboxynorspermidine decarboxylase, partial [Ruminococcaceae bacterium]|nr:carboxynorspermidine decarboxylase [Oscillospiraceae bacterium]